MSNKLTVTIDKEGKLFSDEIECRITVQDPDLIGHKAAFSLEQKVEVKDSRPVNKSRSLFEHKFTISSAETSFGIPKNAFKAFSYQGRKIDIKIESKVVVDDSILFDTKLSQEEEFNLGTKINNKVDANLIIEPKDLFSFFSNLKAIPAQNQITTLVLALAAGILIIVNTLIGAHDQFTPQSQTYFYSHYDSDGDGQSPLMNSLLGSGALGAMLWFAIRCQLRKYMSFAFKNTPGKITPKTELNIADLIQGKSRVSLHDIELKIVACNMEHGQYIRGSGTNQRTVSFKEPVQGIILFAKKVDHIPAHHPIESYFQDQVKFDQMFKTLFPRQMIKSTHGLDIYWEVQLIHPQFVDQELVGPIDVFSYDDFIQA
jgi:hypothetical protein